MGNIAKAGTIICQGSTRQPSTMSTSTGLHGFESEVTGHLQRHPVAVEVVRDVGASTENDIIGRALHLGESLWREVS